MALTLTQTADLTKKSLIFGAIFLFLLIASWVGYMYYINFVYIPPPPPETPPDVFFGKLPKLKITEASNSAGSYAYTLDTDTGSLPRDIPKIFKVYPIASLGTDLLAPDRSKALANKLGFITGPEMQSLTQYLFLDENGGDMVVSLESGNFRFNHRESTESANLTMTNNFSDPERLTKDFKDFLLPMDLLKEQLRDGRSEVFYEKPSINESNFATITLWQEDVDKIPLVTEKFEEGLIKGVINKRSDNRQKVLILDYVFWPIDILNGHTYPILTPEEAYDKLQTQQGFVIKKPLGLKVSITKVYLGYFLSREFQPFLQPVFVFEGDEFVAFVPALRDEQVE
ncbi:MAG: hypothetical protein ACD_30C00003G0004 [uncultured bacterium]|nr:MAG: hypothetical protein ACD_30C00003G0004 [uncultured bacterium]OGE16611.1 MAG: hypothetical protein A2858_02080 [Candidatus Daviesbacteria bacterium RIFCSPHIGHO2_01_FULL_36_37]OGE33672.1 MAG: hypothetical protein A3C99_02155 [Candidatus Daviesbacteria bacterium RIFCSPHIGHO2_02_FULL_37_9]OGE34694.1 MAG: hypothetical protein A3E66_03640 [Candidatus Daviesbacteria bacterium RIFCSPHIGHO2_12_FULL_37_16]